jgi:hypothetical protein
VTWPQKAWLWFQAAWPLVRDIALTITGLLLIISQIAAKDPSSTLIVAGLALTVPAAQHHAGAVLGGPSAPEPGPSESSPPAPPPSSSPSAPGESGE